MKTQSKAQLVKHNSNLAIELENRSKTIAGLKVKLAKQKDLLDLCGKKAAGYEQQIQTLQIDKKIQDKVIVQVSEELQARDHSLRTLESDHAQDMLGTSHLLDKHKQDLYNEQIKATAYMTVIKALHDH
jgi:hypothetical protein